MGVKKYLIIGLFGLFIISLQGCKNWNTLQFNTRDKPIQLGPHITQIAPDTMGTVSGMFKYRFLEDTYSASENRSIVIGGEETMTDDFAEIYAALDDDPRHFIADGYLKAEVSYSFPFSSFVKGLLANWFTGESASGGVRSTEIIYYNGVVYKINAPEL